jgi:hypothetical protein
MPPGRGGERDKTQTGLLSDMYSISYVACYTCYLLWDKSRCLTHTPVQSVLGFSGAVRGAMRLVSESWFVSISVVWESPFCYNRVRLVT